MRTCRRHKRRARCSRRGIAALRAHSQRRQSPAGIRTGPVRGSARGPSSPEGTCARLCRAGSRGRERQLLSRRGRGESLPQRRTRAARGRRGTRTQRGRTSHAPSIPEDRPLAAHRHTWARRIPRSSDIRRERRRWQRGWRWRGRRRRGRRGRCPRSAPHTRHALSNSPRRAVEHARTRGQHSPRHTCSDRAGSARGPSSPPGMVRAAE
jgi:hypothetical protein